MGDITMKVRIAVANLIRDYAGELSGEDYLLEIIERAHKECLEDKAFADSLGKEK